MKNLIIVFTIPFIAFILSVLLICLALVSPFILIGYIWTTSKRNVRRSSQFYPLEKNELKDRIKDYLKRREVRL